MLTQIERLIFVLSLGISLYFTYRGADRIFRVIRRGGFSVNITPPSTLKGSQIRKVGNDTLKGQSRPRCDHTRRRARSSD